MTDTTTTARAAAIAHARACREALTAGSHRPRYSEADLSGADLRGANLSEAGLSEAEGLRDGMPRASALRAEVADQIEAHPELHDQSTWGTGDPAECGTPCCVAGWACRLGGGTYGQTVESAAWRLLWVDSRPMPDFDSGSTRAAILDALRA